MISCCRQYLAKSNCSVNCIPVSGDYEKAKHKIAHVYKAVKVGVPTVVMPKRAWSMIEVLDELVARFYVATDNVLRGHKRVLRKRAQRGLGVPDQGQEGGDVQISEDWEEEDDDPHEEVLSRVAETRAGLRGAASNNAVLIVLKDVISKLKDQGKMVGDLVTSVNNLHEKVDRVEKMGKQQEKALDKLVGDRVVSVAVWCSFCRVATHPLAECRSRKESLICFQDSHTQLVCPLRGLACLECGDPNHSALAHKVSDPVLKEVVKAKFGKKFNFI